MKYLLLCAVLVSAFLVPAGSVRADVSLPSVIDSHMVLQR